VAATADSEAVRDYVSQVALHRQDFLHYLRNLDWAQEWRSASFSTAEDGLAHDARVPARLHEADWNRYGWPQSAGGLVARGFQIDALCGSYHQLEALLAERLFDIYSPGRALPAIIAWD